MKKKICKKYNRFQTNEIQRTTKYGSNNKRQK